MNTDQLQQSIEDIVYKYFKKAFLESLIPVRDLAEGKSITPEDIADKFANTAKECAGPIANAIKTYLSNIRVMIPTGTMIPTLTGLVSPTGPVTGVLNVGPARVIMNNAIITDELPDGLR